MTTEITWLGHGSWSIRTGDHTILLDPFLNDSPTSTNNRITAPLERLPASP